MYLLSFGVGHNWQISLNNWFIETVKKTKNQYEMKLMVEEIVIDFKNYKHTASASVLNSGAWTKADAILPCKYN